MSNYEIFLFAGKLQIRPRKNREGKIGKETRRRKRGNKERRCVRRLEERRKGGEKTKRGVSDRKCEMK